MTRAPIRWRVFVEDGERRIQAGVIGVGVGSDGDRWRARLAVGGEDNRNTAETVGRGQGLRIDKDAELLRDDGVSGGLECRRR